MAYNALNNLIDAYIYANGVQAITGQILNGVLKQMVSQLGSGYHLMGVAAPETEPTANDYAMAYFAATAGEYTNFGGIILAPGEVAVLLTYGNGSWAKRTIYNVPTGTADLENTANFITSTVDDLVYYYTKDDIDTIMAGYPTVDDLATILADYYTKNEIDTILADYTTSAVLASTLADYYNKNDIDGLLSVVNAALADRYTKSETDTKLDDYYKKTETYDKDEVDSIVAALSRQEYIVAWDGLAAPDVSAIPAGVTVTYSGTTYTGVLAASASTVNKIYMVWNGVAYDMYATSQDGGYSWVPMGTTSVDLSQYATKTELSQLDNEIDDLGNDVDRLNDAVLEISSVEDSIALSNYFQGLMRNTTLKIEASTNPNYKVYYFPVLAGKQYTIKGTNVTSISTAWSFIGFSSTIPQNNESYIEVLAPASTGSNNYEKVYIPESDGYLLVYYGDTVPVADRISAKVLNVTITSKIGDLTLLQTTVKTDLVSALNEVVGNLSSQSSTISSLSIKVGNLEELETDAKNNIVSAINEIFEDNLETVYIGNPIALSNNVTGLIMRNTTHKFEATAATNYRVYYIPIISGREYNVVGNNVTNGGATWSLLGYSGDIPEDGGGYTNILNYNTTGAKYFDIDYTATNDGYLCIYYQDTVPINTRIQVTEYSAQKYNLPELLKKGESVEAGNAKDILVSPPAAFNIGLTNLRAKVKYPQRLIIESTGSNYNDCIEQYMNVQDGRRTSRLIQTEHFDLYPNIGDPTKLYGTYFRMLIGVDSEGYAYVAQRRCANNSQGDGVNIYRTKDFVIFDVFKENSAGVQLIEMENGELCLATYENEVENGTTYIRCFIYVTSGNKTVFNKKFACTQISQYTPASPWSWGLQTRGSVVCVGEYGSHGQCGCVWYSRDYGQTFGKIFDLRDKAPDVPHAHIHGVCVDPYFDRVIIINGDGAPSSTPELAYANPKLWWWDYDGETISDSLANTIVWKSSDVGLDTSLGSNLQFVNGYALKDCIVLFSDGANNGIFRVNRGKKEDTLTVDFAFHLGIQQGFTKWCGGNMFRRDENSPLLICGIREYSNDLNPGDPGNPSNLPNTYKDVLSRVFSTYDGYHFEEVWVDNTYGTYDVFYPDDSSEQRTIAKCGRDMSVYQMPNGDVLLKYLGRETQYVSYDDNGITGSKPAYTRFNNEVLKLHFK